MKSMINVCVIGAILLGVADAQESSKPGLQKGVSVQMPLVDHAVEMRAADEPQATIVAITAEGKLYVGIQPTEPGALSKLSAGTVYLKADARVPFQKVLSILDALHGKSVILLSAPPANIQREKMLPPYGTKVLVSQ